MKLNLGAGAWRPAGFVAVDLSGADVNHDLNEMPWPFADKSVTQILASHVLEHFERHAAHQFLSECHRVLGEGCLLRLAVPDMDKFIDCRLAGDYSRLDGYPWTDLNDFLGGGAAEPNLAYRHRYLYCWASLAWTLEQIGFIAKRRSLPCELDNPAYGAISLYADALT